jgi:hypothetical protein
MVKSGDFNPHYFLKPSFHFYLRMPVVALSFLVEVRQSRARTLSDIKTKDPYGIGNYAFYSSHPGVVKGNRLFSLLTSLITLVALYFLTLRISGVTLAANIAAWIFALSPTLVTESSVIGVDVIAMTLITCSLLAATFTSFYGQVVSVLVGGLSTATKYNMLPALLIPLTNVSLLKGALLFLLFWVAFLIGTPFILLELPLFLDHLAYEIWHYGISGHEGHSGEPGVRQFLFYLNWFATNEFGLPFLALSFVGMLLSFKNKVSWSLIIFTTIFLTLMSMQRANFTRNMLPLIPCFGAFIGISSTYLIKKSRFIGVGLVTLSSVPLLLKTYTAVSTSINLPSDSRIVLLASLEKIRKPNDRVIANGKLWLDNTHRPWLEKISMEEDGKLPDSITKLCSTEETLYLVSARPITGMSAIATYPGDPLSRVVRNPQMYLYQPCT